jgi:division protein CdvB (Snf7/Vps24/ESCRT-III family)
MNNSNNRDQEAMDKIMKIMEEYNLEPMEVMEEVGEEYGINFEFGRGY